MKIDYKQLESLIKILKDSDLTEIEVESGKEKMRVARARQTRASSADEAPSINRPSVVPARSYQQSGSKHVITSPFVGTFYRSPGPQAKAFVEVGDRVKPGTVLCIIEAMKLMNEIESDMAGKITAIYVENGQAVEFGAKLFEIDVS